MTNLLRSAGRPVLRIHSLAALLLLLAAPLRAQTDDYTARVFTNSAGKTLPYRLLQPKDYSPQKQYPLVLMLHGSGERGTNNLAQLTHGTRQYLKSENREKFPCFVVVPQCPPQQSWAAFRRGNAESAELPPPAGPMQLALETVEALGQEFSIDTNRLYITGLSMGGFGTWDCVTRYPDRFAAAAPICGRGNPKAVTVAVAKVPVWAFHSDDDPAVPVDGSRSMIRAMRDAGGQPKYFEYFGLGHNSWDKAYSEPEFLPWLFAQRLGQPDNYTLKTPAPELPAVARFPDDAAFPGEGPIRKADWFRKTWQDRRLAFWNGRERDQGAVVFLGDSITQGWGSLAKDFPTLKVANRGISGDVTRGVRFRLQEDVLDLHPAAVVLLIGTNDLEDGGEPDVIANNVRAILEALKGQNAKMPVIVCKVMPSDASKKRPADKIQKLNALVDPLVKGDPQFILCDTYSIFANENGNAKTEEFPDLLHPNAAGYAKWGEALQPILAKLNLAK